MPHFCPACLVPDPKWRGIFHLRLINRVEGEGRMRKMVRVLSAILVVLLLSSAALAEERLRLATTTSTESSGLLKELLAPFEQKNNCRVDVIAVGTGKALKLGETGDVDVVLVHARNLEDKFVADGFGVDRRDVMYNDFVILGPVSDPAGISGMRDVAEAFHKISVSQSVFVSRSDLSGTHSKEKEIWAASGVKPEGKGYLEAGLGMGEVINMAGERQGYTLSDRGTWIAYQAKNNLKILLEGDKRLFNPYGVIGVNPAKHPHVKTALAKAFMDYLTSAEGRQRISSFQVNGQPLFFVYPTAN